MTLFLMIGIPMVVVGFTAYLENRSLRSSALWKNWGILLGIYLMAGFIGALVSTTDEDQTADTVTTGSGQKYTIATLTDTTNIYTDRNYLLLKCSLAKKWKAASIIQTTNADKYVAGNHHFSVVVNQKHAAIYVIHDNRAEQPKSGGVPSWLSPKNGFVLEKNSADLETSDRTHYTVYRKTLDSAGQMVTFGGNLAQKPQSKNDDVNCSMYFVLISAARENIENYNALWKLDEDSKDPNLSQIDTMSANPVTRPYDAHPAWSVKSLKQKLDDHQLWISSKTKDGTRLDLNDSIIDSAKWIKNTEFKRCNFSKADMISRTVINSKFKGCRFMATELFGANLQNDAFLNSLFNDANFNSANLSNCKFLGSDFQDANFLGTHFDKNTDFSYCDMSGVVFEPDSLPNIQGMALATNLESMSYVQNPSALIRLREELKKAGFDEAQRKITAAIRRRWDALNPNGLNKKASYILFDFTCAYGTDALRPLILVLINTYIFLNIYLLMFFAGWLNLKVYYTETVEEDGKYAPATFVIPTNIFKVVFLTIISCISIGFGEFKFDDWVKRLYAKDYIMETQGITRVLVGIQGLISLILFALAILVYFGDPFNQ